MDFSVAKLPRYKELWSRIETESTNSAKRDLSPYANGMVYHIRVCTTVCNIPALLIENRSFIEKLDENEAESQRIETVTLFTAAQQQFLFRMLLPVLVYPIPASC